MRPLPVLAAFLTLAMAPAATAAPPLVMGFAAGSAELELGPNQAGWIRLLELVRRYGQDDRAGFRWLVPPGTDLALAEKRAATLALLLGRPAPWPVRVAGSAAGIDRLELRTAPADAPTAPACPWVLTIKDVALPATIDGTETVIHQPLSVDGSVSLGDGSLYRLSARSPKGLTGVVLLGDGPAGGATARLPAADWHAAPAGGEAVTLHLLSLPAIPVEVASLPERSPGAAPPASTVKAFGDDTRQDALPLTRLPDHLRCRLVLKRQ